MGDSQFSVATPNSGEIYNENSTDNDDTSSSGIDDDDDDDHGDVYNDNEDEESYLYKEQVLRGIESMAPRHARYFYTTAGGGGADDDHHSILSIMETSLDKGLTGAPDNSSVVASSISSATKMSTETSQRSKGLQQQQQHQQQKNMATTTTPMMTTVPGENFDQKGYRRLVIALLILLGVFIALVCLAAISLLGQDKSNETGGVVEEIITRGDGSVSSSDRAVPTVAPAKETAPTPLLPTIQEATAAPITGTIVPSSETVEDVIPSTPSITGRPTLEYGGLFSHETKTNSFYFCRIGETDAGTFVF